MVWSVVTEQLFHTPGLILGTHSIPWSSSVLDQLWGLVGGALKTSRLSDLRASGPYRGVSLVAQMVKNLPVMQETRVQSLGLGRSPEEGNGNPLQYSCLENSMDRGAWRVTVRGVAKSQTQPSNETTTTTRPHPHVKP